MKLTSFYAAIFILLLQFNATSQDILPKDSTLVSQTMHSKEGTEYKQYILPVALMAYGIIGLESDFIKDINIKIKEKVSQNVKEQCTIDNYLQFTPVATVYALNLLGVKGKHNLAQRSILVAASYLITTGTVQGLKKFSKVDRPDGSSHNSFPSGHTATAFAGAEFLMQEYKNVSIWIGIGGYAAATATGSLRIYNGRHWLTDVTMGAGMGILSTKLAYWVTPKLFKNVFKANKLTDNTNLSTFYNNGSFGLNLSLNLK